MDINNGSISGRVLKCDQLTTQRGTGFASLTIGSTAFQNGQEVEDTYNFAFFREAADVCASLKPGMRVMVNYKLKIKPNGYSDLSTTGLVILGEGQPAQQQSVTYPAPPTPQAYRQQAKAAYSTAQSVQAPATPYQQNAQRAQQAAYGVPQAQEDEPF